MRDGPARGGEELIAVRAEFGQILQVAAPWSQVDGCVELEADHVEAPRKPGDEAAVIMSIEAPEKADREAQVEQRIRGRG